MKRVGLWATAEARAVQERFWKLSEELAGLGPAH